MAKTDEEIENLTERTNSLLSELADLSEEDLDKVSGGIEGDFNEWVKKRVAELLKQADERRAKTIQSLPEDKRDKYKV